MVAAGATRPRATGARCVRRDEEVMGITGKMMLVTVHDLASVASGRALMCGLSDDGEGLLRLAGTPRDPESLAETRALRDDLPILTVTLGDIDQVLHGATVLTFGDPAVAGVRMMTSDELLAAHAAACRKFGGEPSLSKELAEELTRTL